MSLGFSKLAIMAFVHNLTPSKLHRKINYGVGALACLWVLCAVLIAAFQCRIPRTWDRTQAQCADRVSQVRVTVRTNSDCHKFVWWNAISVFNIITEVAIVALELGITAQLQINRQRKASIMSLFACRVL